MNRNCTDHEVLEQHMINWNILKTRGWMSFTLAGPCEADLREQLFALAAKFGEPTATRSSSDLCDSLIPTPAHAARSRSLSRLYSLGEFPLHNDTAHWPSPCRYVILACASVGNGSRPTFLLDTRTLPVTNRQDSLLHTAPLRVRNGRNSFFSTILSNSRPFVRFDPGCMTSIDSDSAEALATLLRPNWAAHVETVHWKTGMVLVIDNWRVLHGRGCGYSSNADRKLLRVLIR